MLKIKNLSLTFGERAILDDINMDVAEGEIVALLGPSGCGKTSILNIIAGFLSPSGGSVSTEIDCPGPRLGYMRQDHGLLPWLNAFDNATLAFRLDSERGTYDAQKVRNLFEKFDLGECIHSFPQQMSGGQRQRLALLRTLLGEPQLLLMDEPLGHLDAALRIELVHQVRGMIMELNAAAVIVTHQMDEAVLLADRILVLGETPTRLIASEVPSGKARNFFSMAHAARQEDILSFIRGGA